MGRNADRGTNLILNLITYGSVLYWALLFVFIYMLTIFAVERKDTLRPNIWGALTLIYIFGFTSYHEDAHFILLQFAAYFCIGVGYAMFKWMDLVGQISTTAKTLKGVSQNDYQLRHMLYRYFKPTNTEDTVSLPPDPYEFRTRITLWFLYWPCFMLFRPLHTVTVKSGRILWNVFHKMSMSIYDDRD